MLPSAVRFGLCLVAALQGPAFAQSVRLSGPLARSGPGGPIVGDVLAFQLAGERVVYRADASADQRFDLFSARLDGRGAPVPLTASLTTAGSITPSFAVSPDGELVVFEQRSLLDQTRWLYVVPTRGGVDPLLLDGPSVFTPPFLFGVGVGGARLVYRRQGADPNALDLYNVALDGTEPPFPVHPVHPDIPAERTVSEVQLGWEGREVLFLADHGDTAGQDELYVAPIDYSDDPRRLSTGLAEGGGVFDFLVTPDGLDVVYNARDGGHPKPVNLYSASTDRSRPVERLTDMRRYGGVWNFTLTSDGRRVVFLGGSTTNSRNRLNSALVSGRAPALGVPGGRTYRGPVLLSPLPSDWTVKGWRIDADGTRVVYMAGPLSGYRYHENELFSVPADGSSSSIQLYKPPSQADVLGGFELAPDGEHVVYSAGYNRELYRVPIDGGPALDYGTLADPTGYIWIAPDSSFVFYLNAYGERLFAVPFDASGPPRMLSASMSYPSGVEWDLVVLPGGMAIYLADQQEHETFELFAGFYERARPEPR